MLPELANTSACSAVVNPRTSSASETARGAGARGFGATRAFARPIGQAQPIANVVFSISAGLASLLVAVLAAVKGAPAVAVVFGMLFVGFLLRARDGYRRRGGL
jgi:hypothetical protein